jgi:nitroreductase
MNKHAETQTPIHDLIGHRWSPRAFSAQPVEPDKLLSVLEAARWAPSSRNEQPWTYLVATRDDQKEFDDLLAVLMTTNRAWAQKAPVLILAVAHTLWTKEGTPNRVGIYDLGLATMNLVTQATALGLVTHQMGGFDVEAARERFRVPAGWEPICVIALGHAGKLEDLPEALRERELAQRQRKPLEEFVFSGTWGHPAPITGHSKRK